MNIVFFEDSRKRFFPLTYTKPLAKIRFGILTIEEKWQKAFEKLASVDISYLTEEYLSNKYPLKEAQENIFINARFCPDEYVADFIINKLSLNEAIFKGDSIVAAKCSLDDYFNSNFVRVDSGGFDFIELTRVTDIFSKNDKALITDYNFLTKGRESHKISSTNMVIGDDIFVEEGAKIEATTLNTKTGPIYIGKDSEIMEGGLIRGPFSLGDNAVLKLGTKIYGATTVGPYSKVGGEVNNSVIQGYSNKGHDGFMGNSIIGEWCNLGADTNTSNLKNNYGEVKTWSYETENYENSGLQFCGLLMGDHSKCSINTMFNTGTTVGVNANIFGDGFPPKFVPSYSWGGSGQLATYDLEKSFEVAKRVMERRGIELSEMDKDILSFIFEKETVFR